MKSLIQDSEQQYKHEEMRLLNHVVVVNCELDMMVSMALWNNTETDFEIALEVTVEVIDVEVVVVDEEMKTIDFVQVVEIGSTHQNDGNTS